MVAGEGGDNRASSASLPEEVQHLLKFVYIKVLCRTVNVEKLDAGPKGVVIQFRKKEFGNPAALIKYIGEQGSLAKIRPDQGVMFMRDWPTPDKRLAGSAVIMTQLARMVEGVDDSRNLRTRKFAQFELYEPNDDTSNMLRSRNHGWCSRILRDARSRSDAAGLPRGRRVYRPVS
jgi:hypothetical protein